MTAKFPWRTKHISIREDDFFALRDTFWSVPKGIVYLAEQFVMIYPQRLADLKGMFSQRELLLMIDALKSVKTFPRHLPAGRFFFDHVKFQITDNRYAIKWDVDGDKLLETLSWLMAEPYTILSLALWVWAATHGTHGKDRDDYIKELLK